MPWIIGGAILGGSAIAASSARSASEGQIAFQSDMSSSAHQRQVADMRAAGLNPILSATGGKGASTPSGSMPSEFFGSRVAEAASTALAAKRQKVELELMREQGNKVVAEKEFLREQKASTMIDNFVRGRVAHDEISSRKSGFQASATAANLERGLDESSGELYRTLNRLGITGSTAAQILRGIRR